MRKPDLAHQRNDSRNDLEKQPQSEDTIRQLDKVAMKLLGVRRKNEASAEDLLLKYDQLLSERKTLDVVVAGKKAEALAQRRLKSREGRRSTPKQGASQAASSGASTFDPCAKPTPFSKMVTTKALSPKPTSQQSPKLVPEAPINTAPMFLKKPAAPLPRSGIDTPEDYHVSDDEDGGGFAGTGIKGYCVGPNGPINNKRAFSFKTALSASLADDFQRRRNWRENRL
jgi:hypothetical protein